MAASSSKDAAPLFRMLIPLAEQLEKQPTFPIGEALFLAAAALAFLHALSAPSTSALSSPSSTLSSPRARRLLFFLVCLLGGAANDLFFMFLPLVDNFWHAQATLMLGPRLPAYIPCVYIAFGYWPHAAASRLASRRAGLPKSAQAAAAALAACVFYAAFDLVGQKFLWWTWHDTDAGVHERWLGVPVGSTLWTLVHTFVLVWLSLSLLGREGDGEGGKRTGETGKTGAASTSTTTPTQATVAVLALCICTTPLMMVAMGVLQLHQLRVEKAQVGDAGVAPEGQLPAFGGLVVTQQPGRPDWPTLCAAVLLAIVTLARGLFTAHAKPQPASPVQAARRMRGDYAVVLAIFAYYAVLVFTMASGRPEAVVATGVHQEYGPCGVTASDLSGYTRKRYLCAADFDEDFCFCPGEPLPPAGATWYSLCGTPFGENRWKYMSAVAVLGTVGTLYFAWLILSQPAAVLDVKKRL